MFLKFREDVVEALGNYGDERFIRESEYADLASTIAFKVAKEKGKSPSEIAEEIISKMEIKSDYIGSVQSVNGYINFFASYEFLEDTIEVILDTDNDYGSLKLKGEVLVEHTSANPDGPLHIGHIRNSIIGDTLARILKKAGLKVKTQYYVNDMGRQIAITVLGFERFGLSDKKPDHAVAEVYVSMNKLIEEKKNLDDEVEKLMLLYEEGDDETARKFRYVVEKALEGIKQTLERLNIVHDEFVWESEFIRNGYVDKILKMLN